MGALDRLRALAGGDRDAARLLDTGLFDAEWFAAQTGRDYPSPRAAAREYLAAGRRDGYSPHPLFEPDYADRGGSGEALRPYLATPASWDTSPHPLFDLKAAGEQLAGLPAGGRPQAVWARWAGTATPESLVPTGGSQPPLVWGELRRLLLDVARQWRESGAVPEAGDWRTAAGVARVAGRTSIVLPAARNRSGMARQLRWLRRAPAEADWELVLAGVKSRGQWAFLRARAGSRPLVLVAARGANPTVQLNAAVLASRGETVVIAERDEVLDADLVTALADAVADPRVAVAQPLNVHADSTVYSAGAWFPGPDGTAAPLLGGHRAEDGERLGGATLPAVFSTAVAFRAATFLALEGYDPELGELVRDTDLSLRARDRGLGESRLVPGARIAVGSIHGQVPTPVPDADSLGLLRRRWPTPPDAADALARAGFRLRGADGPALLRIDRADLAAERPGLRWALDIAAPVGVRGDTWGDRHFALALAAALRRLGQDVTIDHREARVRPSRRHDDVVLVLRGRDRVEPTPGPLHLLWVISHPDEVTADEAFGYDAVFAASQDWAQHRSADWGLDVRPLLQCTDPEVFHPGRAAPDSGPRVLFVGNSRGVARPVVLQAIAAGAPVQVYGAGWEGMIPERNVAAAGAANDEVAALYASAGVVLNDHWDDMRRDGFLSNRLFDAVACGARVVSDPVLGLREVFGDAVQVFESDADLARLLTEPFDAFPGLAERQQQAARIATEHSFDARAAALLAAAVQRLRQRAG